MKRLLPVLVCAVIALSMMTPTSSRAQGYGHVISADPIGLAFGMLNATYEQKVGATNSFTVYGSYWSIGSDWSAYGFGGSYRWYFDMKDGKRPLEGLSAGPAASIGFWKWGGNTFLYNYAGGTSFAIGGELAYKWLFGQFSVEPILRLMFNAVSISGLSYQAYGVGVNLGYAW